MKLARRKAVWITTLLVLTSLLSWAALRLWNGKKPEQIAWRSRGKVSEILLQLSGEGPKGVEALRVPDGFDVEVAAGPDLVSYAMFAIVDERGRLFACESAGRNATDQELAADPSFRIRLLEDTNDDGVYDRSLGYSGLDWFRTLLILSNRFVLTLDRIRIAAPGLDGGHIEWNCPGEVVEQSGGFRVAQQGVFLDMTSHSGWKAKQGLSDRSAEWKTFSRRARIRTRSGL